MNKPTTVLAVAVLVASPALINFARGRASAFSAAVWLLVAVLGAGIGLTVLARILHTYSQQARHRHNEGTQEDQW